jgi:hypothetical protein
MGRILPRHVVLLVMSLAWFAGAWWYWDTSVPIPSSRVTPRDDRVASVSKAGASDTVLLYSRRFRPVQKNDNSVTPTLLSPDSFHCGPLQVFNPATGEILSTCLDRDDEILRVSFSDPMRVAVKREDRLRIVDLPEGRSRWEVPLANSSQVQLVSDGRIVLVQRRDGLTAHDAATGDILWVKPIHLMGSYVDRRLDFFSAYDVKLEAATPGKPAATKSVAVYGLINAHTGEPEQRYAEARNPSSSSTAHLSPDGRWLAIDTSPSSRVMFDARSGKYLWTLNERNNVTMSFSADGREVRLAYVGPVDRIRHARWNSADGTPLAELPARANTLRTTDVGRQLTAYSVRVDGKVWHPMVQRWFSRLGMERLNKPLVYDRDLFCLADRETGAVEAILPDGVQRVISDASGRGFTAMTRTELLYFELPLHRDWPWLWTRGLVPPIVFSLVATAFGGWRSKRAIRAHAAVDDREVDSLSAASAS